MMRVTGRPFNIGWKGLYFGLCENRLLYRKRPTDPVRMVAVGTRMAPRPAHRSRRALLTHRARLASGVDRPQLRAQPPIGSTWQLGGESEPLFPLGEALPSTASAGCRHPLFGRFLGCMAS